MKQKALLKLDKLYNDSPIINISNDDRIVIFSDIHLGNGGYQDDFKQNSQLFANVLKDYYLKKNYRLILNGDIEELYKFRISKIVQSWKNIFSLFEEFRENGNLIKIFGNHDYELHKKFFYPNSLNLMEAIRLNYLGDNIFIYHGHQNSHYFEDYNILSSWFGRFILNPIGYKNISLSVKDNSKFETEKHGYEFASKKKIVSILGHTHRPLFESHSKIDSLRIRIERLFALLNDSSKNNKNNIIKLIQKYKEELDGIFANKNKDSIHSNIYNDKILVPCLFNSGSVIGKRGSTCIEIKNGNIYLIYWFDSTRSSRYFDYDGVKVKQLNSTPFHRAVLKKDSLNNIFQRIKLLS